jgi:hypothetical protein
VCQMTDEALKSHCHLQYAERGQQKGNTSHFN